MLTLPIPAPVVDTRRSGGLGQQARPARAKEDHVLSSVRRAVTLAISAVAAALPFMVVLVDGAKRWY